MAREVYRFAVTVPAGTLPSAPQLTELPQPPRTVTEVDVLIPPGPRGMVGFALAMAGTPILPTNRGAWIVSDNELIRWPLEGQPDSGAWQLRIYNQGQFPHTLEIRFLDDLPGAVVAAGPDLVPADQLAPPAPAVEIPLPPPEPVVIPPEPVVLPPPPPPPIDLPPPPPPISELGFLDASAILTAGKGENEMWLIVNWPGSKGNMLTNGLQVRYLVGPADEALVRQMYPDIPPTIAISAVIGHGLQDVTPGS